MTECVRKISVFLAAAATIIGVGFVHAGQRRVAVAAPTRACPEDSGLSLPPGFCATIFADGIGHARHMTVDSDGTVYVNTLSNFLFPAPPPAGGFIVALKDVDGDGRAESVVRFGPTAAEGNAGGTGIGIYKGHLYVETNDKIVRYALAAGGGATREVILAGMPLSGEHRMHGFAIDEKGGMFVNMGSATNACEAKGRQPGSLGQEPCGELEGHGGIWRYSADRPGQHFSPAERYATGIRNTGGISFDAEGRMFAVQHGRDLLAQNWPAFYDARQGQELPAEELISPTAGSDFGWPHCYYDGARNARVLAPEYGGDGRKIGLCAGKKLPVVAFPAHWAPNDVLIYRGDQFPAGYRGGAFIAFHGSWNRAPGPQGGYNVVFQPLAGGLPAGPYLRFADGFAGEFKDPGRAAHRPSGLAMGPDGTLYISDDVNGRIWRVTYHGPRAAPLVSAPAVESAGRVAHGGRSTPEMALPPGVSAEQVALGNRIYHGELRDGTCSGCHGVDARGTTVGPRLTGPDYLWGDGSVESLAKAIREGVAEPKKYAGSMPANGGSLLSDDDVKAVAAYLWVVAHRKPGADGFTDVQGIPPPFENRGPQP